MKTFISSKNIFFYYILWFVVILFAIIIFVNKQNQQEPLFYIFYLIIIPVLFCIVWILLDTKYIIKEEFLFYYSGPIRGKIAIKSIRKLENNHSFFVNSNLKPALGNRGFIVHYNLFDDLYISPKDKKAFENEILKINPNVIIVP